MGKPNFLAAEKYVFKRLHDELPLDLHFHSPLHTKEVLTAAERLAKLERVSDEEGLLLKTAAVYHDTGFLEQYMANEPIGARIAEETLPNFGYNSRQIEIIKGLILATQMPQKPKTRLQQIMCDSDLDHLGRDDFFIKGELLKLEWEKKGIISNTRREWYEGQINFLEGHEYFTDSAKGIRNEGKLKHINELKNLLTIN